MVCYKNLKRVLCVRVHCRDAQLMHVISVSLVSCDKQRVSVPSEPQQSKGDSLFDLLEHIPGEQSPSSLLTVAGIADRHRLRSAFFKYQLTQSLLTSISGTPFNNASYTTAHRHYSNIYRVLIF